MIGRCGIRTIYCLAKNKSKNGIAIRNQQFFNTKIRLFTTSHSTNTTVRSGGTIKNIIKKQHDKNSFSISTVGVKVFKSIGYFYLALTSIPIGLGCIAGYNYLIKKDERHMRGSLFYSWTGWLCLPLSVPVILAYPYVYLCDKYQRNLMDDIQKTWARTTTKYFFKTNVVGTENIVQLNGKPAVYISNHQSWLDAYALFWIDFVSLKIVLKRELMLIPVVGWALNAIGHIPFNRSNKKSGSNAIKDCVDLLENNASVFLFPEGTRSKDGKLRPFKIGAFKIAVDNNVPIVPITIHGTRAMMPPGDELSLGTDDINVEIYKPIYPKDNETANELRDRVRLFYLTALQEE
jgi:1-acyl-sn-glycerol-3-phosphate acyltransferase